MNEKGCFVMVDYMITAQAEVLYEKAYGILAKYTKYTSNKKTIILAPLMIWL